MAIPTTVNAGESFTLAEFFRSTTPTINSGEIILRYNNSSGTTFANAGTTFENNGKTIVEAFSSLINENNGSDLGILNNNGLIASYYRDSEIKNSATFNNNSTGRIDSSGQVRNLGSGTFNNEGQITIQRVDESYIDNFGTFNNKNGGTIDVLHYLNNFGTLNNKSGGTVNVSDYLSNSGTLNNEGKITSNSNYGSDFYNYGTINNDGGTIDNGNYIYNYDGGTIDNNGTIRNITDEGGKITGSGMFDIPNLSITSGVFQPEGASASGAFNLDGGTLQLFNPTNTLLTVNGDVNLNSGAIQFDDLSGFGFGLYTLIDGESNLNIDAGVLTTAQNTVNSFDTATKDLELLQQGNDLVLTVESLNSLPNANDDSFTTDENSNITIDISNLLANDSDPDGDTLTVNPESIDDSSTQGTAFFDFWSTTPSITYDPNGQFADLNNGETATDSFSYTINDGNGGTDTATVTISITGISDNSAPQITSNNTATVEENQTFAIDVNATDDSDSEDAGLTYSLAGDDATLFNINQNTGEINFKTAPDFEAPADANGDNDYLLQVKATDSGGLSDTQDLIISVSDLNEVNLDDNLRGSNRNDTINGGDGDDTIKGLGGHDELNGDAGNDILRGDSGNDTLNGGAGEDIINGSTGKDFLTGGDGNDRLSGDRDNDTLDGGIGNDTLNGNSGKDVLFGGDGDDILNGGGSNDTLRGGMGNDVLRGNSSRDVFVLALGEGTDIIADFSRKTDKISLADGLTYDDLSFSGKDILSGGETLATLNINTSSLRESDFRTI